MRRLTSIWVGTALAALAVGAASADRPTKGQPAPDFTATALDGRKVALANYRDKNVLILTFFAEFTPSSRKDFQHLRDLLASRAAEGTRKRGERSGRSWPARLPSAAMRRGTPSVNTHASSPCVTQSS